MDALKHTKHKRTEFHFVCNLPRWENVRKIPNANVNLPQRTAFKKFSTLLRINKITRPKDFYIDAGENT